jgi:hypothetical protein
MPRYVVLHHQFPAGHARIAHWDLMLEHDGVLRTWALPGEPRAGTTLWAEALADHRLAYLDYEGPVSADRGWVQRWDQGTYALHASTDERLEATLTGERLVGSLRLERGSEAHFWSVSFGAAPTSG